MTDLDFEELDKAVNSAMKSDSSEKQTDDTNVSVDVKVESKNFDQQNTQATTQDRKILTTNPRQTENKVFKSRQTTRSTGRFMDVVHPSSDMRAGIKKDFKSEDDKKNIPDQDIHDMPDPIDSSSTMVKEASEEKKPSSDSPFIAGAKVEKRPLGAFSEMINAEDSMDDKKSDIKTPEDQTKKTTESEEDSLKDEPAYEPNTETRNVHLPPELQKDILDVESDPTTDKLNVVKHKTSNEPVALGNPYLHTAQAEISPQYKEKKSEEKTSGSIYDTKDYHSPLLHPDKKKKGWLTVLWIVLTVVAAIGLVYFVSTYLFAKQ